MLIASRVVNGVACGLANAVIPMYMSEISPVKTRGLFASLYQLAFTIGILLAYVIGFAFSGTSDWRSMFLFGTVPAIILLILYFFLSESPRWLLFKKRDEEAKLVFSKIEEEGEANKQIEEIKSSMADAQSNTNVSIKKWMLVPLFISIGLMFAQICTGINVIICYSSTIFQSVGFDNPSDAMKITVGIGIVNFLMTFVAMYLSDKVGRKPLLISGIILMAISMFAFAGANHFATALGDYSKWISVIAIVGFICSFAYSLGPVCWILISEIFPIEAKGVLTTFPVAANFIFCILLNALFPVMKESLGTTTTFSILGLVCVISFIFLVFCVPETKGISLEKIEENWKNGVKPCDF
jgi:sugar porter (SP) family MFS transporter